MDIEKIRELAKLMNEQGLSRLKLEENDTKVELEKSAPQNQCTAPLAETSQSTQEAPEDTGVFTVRSPMVGVFYAAPSPDTKVFASVGDTVHKGDVLCIIEAMKLMNDITADRDGEIIEVCAGNGQVVEYDQPLFRMR